MFPCCCCCVDTRIQIGDYQVLQNNIYYGGKIRELRFELSIGVSVLRESDSFWSQAPNKRISLGIIHSVELPYMSIFDPSYPLIESENTKIARIKAKPIVLSNYPLLSTDISFRISYNSDKMYRFVGDPIVYDSITDAVYRYAKEVTNA